MKYKGQIQLMEQIITLFFIIIIIVFIIFFLTVWQVSRANVEKNRVEQRRAMNILKRMIVSEYLVKENSMFDDSKLTSMLDRCEDLEKLFGENWFAEIKIINGKNDIPCSPGVYDTNCNLWTYCKKKGNFTSYILPVNVYRKVGWIFRRGIVPKVYPAYIKVGVYHETKK